MARRKQIARAVTSGNASERRAGVALPRTTGRIKYPRKVRSGVAALREIRKAQTQTELVVPRLAFQRLIKEICAEHASQMRFQSTALGALQESTEQYIIKVLEEANLCAIHAKRVTIMPLALRIRHPTTWACESWGRASDPPRGTESRRKKKVSGDGVPVLSSRPRPAIPVPASPMPASPMPVSPRHVSPVSVSPGPGLHHWAAAEMPSVSFFREEDWSRGMDSDKCHDIHGQNFSV
ncbi:hypothetical protein G3M48_005411 [Beauveria asiatica]|uniref:Core Histone H2A/H2B/H3 domain-containing protein n=1 Tax=Beauveria asiatica TaxID=1069075 RepID=A0AAW0RR56_9HYPO